MKFANILTAFVAALISLLLIFGCYREKTAMETSGGLDDIKNLSSNYSTQITALQTKLEELNTQIEQSKAEMELLQSRENYKTQPTAFLTFDGGFTSNTVKIVNVLNEYDIKGTFYVIGKNLRNNKTMQEELKKAAEAGHKIGIRSDSDDLSKIYSSEEAYFEDLYACRDLIREITGEAPVLVRMPGGTGTASNKKYGFESEEVYAAVLARLEREGFMLNDWTTNSDDHSSGVDDIVSKTLKGSQASLNRVYKTNLILFTDTSKTSQALPRIIEGLKELGYQFSGVPSAIQIIRHR